MAIATSHLALVELCAQGLDAGAAANEFADATYFLAPNVIELQHPYVLIAAIDAAATHRREDDLAHPRDSRIARAPHVGEMPVVVVAVVLFLTLPAVGLAAVGIARRLIEFRGRLLDSAAGTYLHGRKLTRWYDIGWGILGYLLSTVARVAS